jgi:pyruvate dehydrogenase E2 component (dihydrolipoamide acetyltransferase)
MSKFDFKLPDIGEGVMEGEIVKWLVQPGDAVSEDQPMVEVMTDKATVTITSPKTGTIVELGGKEGSVIPVHSTLVVLDLKNGGVATGRVEPAPARRPSDDGPAATAVGDIREELPGLGLATRAPVSSGAASSGAASVAPYFNDRPLATPATRKLARDLGVDLRTVVPSGKGGRIQKEDLTRSPAPAAPPPPSPGPPAAARAPVAPLPAEPERETRRPLKGVRKRIFDAMARSKHTAAHFTFVEECDVTALIELRKRMTPLAADEGVKLTFLPFFVKAVVAALKRHPSLNSAFDEASGEIVERRYYNIGIASATDSGLMVPVVKDADRKSIVEIARDVARLSDATKSGSVTADDLRGSTFTITSLGAQGGLFATPILNLPEVGILGLHQMKQKPVVRDGQIVVGDVMLLSLSFDHRIIDGHVGAAFAYEIIGLIEQPDRLWLTS